MTDNLPSDWLQEYPYESSIEILTGLARFHAAQAGAYSQAIISLLEASDYLGICDFGLDYRVGHSVTDLIQARQALAFFQKLEPLKIGLDKESIALVKFKEMELLCKDTNTRMRELISGSRENVTSPLDPEVAAVLHYMQRNISEVLGSVPRLDALKFEFGPGANTTVKSRTSSPRFKLGARLACSSELAGSVSTLLDQVPMWSQRHAREDDYLVYGVNDSSDNIAAEVIDPSLKGVEFIDTMNVVDVEIQNGKLQFVPKSAKTYRAIVVEPILNSFAQKGIGSFLKGRLLRAGLDLQTQQVNQLLARVGSLDDSLATIDLSSASDTISREVVAMLLPLDWYSFLSRFRTGRVEYRGEVITLEKFSSMGNAYTFELESLIFWTCARGVCSHLSLSYDDAKAFGDDIIVPTAAVPLLRKVLSYLGFIVNEAKSFSDGPFRESCGTDWYHGIDIRPYYQKTLVSAETLFTLHNFYARSFDFAACARVVEWIHPSLRIFGPDGYGDGHLIGSFEPVTKKKHAQRGWDGAVFDTFSRRKRVSLAGVKDSDGRKPYHILPPGDFVLPTYSIYVSPPPSPEPNLWFWNEEYETELSDHLVVRGSWGYKRQSIYTLSRGIYF